MESTVPYIAKHNKSRQNSTKVSRNQLVNLISQPQYRGEQTFRINLYGDPVVIPTDPSGKLYGSLLCNPAQEIFRWNSYKSLFQEYCIRGVTLKITPIQGSNQSGLTHFYWISNNNTDLDSFKTKTPLIIKHNYQRQVTYKFVNTSLDTISFNSTGLADSQIPFYAKLFWQGDAYSASGNVQMFEIRAVMHMIFKGIN